MFKLKSTLAACVPFAMIGGIIACMTRPAASGDSDEKTNPPQESPAATAPTVAKSAPDPPPAETLVAQADEAATARTTTPTGKKPNIVVIMGDDIRPCRRVRASTSRP